MRNPKNPSGDKSRKTAASGELQRPRAHLPDQRSTDVRAHEIAPEDWLAFLDSFSRQHEGWLVTIEFDDPNDGKLIEVENRELDGVTRESANGHERIVISVGKDEDSHLTHFVSEPKRVRFLETSGGGHLGLEIESADGSRTLVRFRAPMRPEMLDGLAA